MGTSISLIISTFNRPELLSLALLSAAAQRRPPDEVLVADDGSSAVMMGAIDRLLPRLPFPVVYVTQADAGFRLARARNNGARAASGEYLVSTDQDILFTPGYLETYARYAAPGRFLVSSIVRLDEEQTARVTEETISRSALRPLVTRAQAGEVAKQHRKDAFYAMLRRLRLRSIGPKLRGGVFGVWKKDLVAVNGFDERYIGWGNEDDDLGHRLDRYGVTGMNPFCRDFPVHLWHPANNGGGVRVNREYYEMRLGRIARGEYRAEFGLDNPLGDDLPVVTRFPR